MESVIASKKIIPLIFLDETLYRPLNFKHCFNIFPEATFALLWLATSRRLSDEEYKKIFENSDFLYPRGDPYPGTNEAQYERFRGFYKLIETEDTDPFPLVVEKYIDWYFEFYDDYHNYGAILLEFFDYDLIKLSDKMGFFQLKHDIFPFSNDDISVQWAHPEKRNTSFCIMEYDGPRWEELIRETIKKHGTTRLCNHHQDPHYESDFEKCCALNNQYCKRKTKVELVERLEKVVQGLKVRTLKQFAKTLK